MAQLNETLIIWETTPKSGKWAMLGFDAVLTEGHSGGNTVTSYPVDSGFVVSDHAIRHNRQFTLNTMTSNVTLNTAVAGQTFRDAFEALTARVAHAGGSSNGTNYEASEKYGSPRFTLEQQTFDNETNRFRDGELLVAVSEVKVDEVFTQVKQLVAQGTLVHCLTLRGWYLNCVIRSYGNSNDVHNAHCLPMELQIEELNVIDTSKVSSTTGVAVRSPATIVKKSLNLSEESAADFDKLEHKQVPFSEERDTEFTYRGVKYTLGAIQVNEVTNCPTTSLTWQGGAYTSRREDGTDGTGTQAVYENEVLDGFVSSLFIYPGVNMVAQFNTGLPSLVAVHTEEFRGDIGVDIKNMQLYIIEDYERFAQQGFSL